MCRCPRWGRNLGPATEPELQRNRYTMRRTQSGTEGGDEDKFPVGCESCDGTSRTSLQISSEIAQMDCGRGCVQVPSLLPATGTWPWLERWTAKGSMKRECRKLPLP